MLRVRHGITRGSLNVRELPQAGRDREVSFQFIRTVGRVAGAI